ncbi:hypothetical protein ACLI09_03125 [Flavobacterium sp. RHBU_24]|uniref:hypothetical protein n=1 Tax=Flavobacterium sp. RHBU_24 TaxID=3391185 RepID=UPI00398504AC
MSKPTYVILLATALLFIYNHFIYDPIAGEGPELDALNDLQKQILATLSEMTKLLISLSTALFGLIGYFALENFKKVGKIELKFQADFVAAFCATAISLDFGYIFMEKLVELLSVGVFNPYDRIISIPRNLQIIAFLCALFFSGRLILRNLFKPVRA